MRFGVFFQAPESPGQTHAERYAEMLELVEFADSLGFDVAWLAEIHFGGAFSFLLVRPGLATAARGGRADDAAVRRSGHAEAVTA